MDKNQYKESEKEEQGLDLLDDNGSKLVLYNDDYHTFDYVIKALVDICRHTYEQAEQCTIMIHYTGKCIVKSGGYEELLPMHTALLNKQLTSEIIQ
ncbi:MAG: ATP-dependent Clp protease adaptor ClpS [Bacteroidales bacterium]|nr:ATP-dependent Clp protease adaptor ClpS [Bacteroidales bacterium]